MLSHLLTLAARSLWRHRVTSAINLLALSLGLLCFALAAAFATAVDKADSRWPNAERIAVVTERVDGSRSNWGGMGHSFIAPMTAGYLRTDYPELEAVSTTRPLGTRSVQTGKATMPAEVTAVDENFTRIFTWPLRRGNWQAALSRPGSAVISQDVAQTLFGDDDPVGKSFTLGGQDVTVTGVIAEFPAQMTQFNNWHLVVVTADVAEALQLGLKPKPEIWIFFVVQTYVLLPPGESIRAFDRRLTDFASRHILSDDGNFQFGAMALSGITQSLFEGVAGIPLSRLFLLLGGLVLGVACLNYINLASGLSHVRRPEMALRRILGEGRLSIIGQILLECGLLAVAALTLVLGVLWLLVPVMAGNKLNGAGLDFPLSLPAFWGRLILGTVSAVFAGGLYPAMSLSHAGGRGGPGAIRGSAARFLPTSLVATQFLLGSLLIIGVLMIQAQSAFLRQAIDPPEEDMVLVAFALPADLPLPVLRDHLKALPRFRAVSSSAMPLFTLLDVEPYQRSDEPTLQVQTIVNQVGEDFFTTLGVQFLAGRDFSPDHADDSSLASPSGIIPVIIDRSLAQALGWTPSEAIGRSIVPSDPKQHGDRLIVGVIEDRATTSFNRGGRGSVYRQVGGTQPNAVFRIARQDSAATIEAILAQLRNLSPQSQARLFPMAQTLEWNDQTASWLRYLGGLAGFALLIGVIGLCGMALHVTARRRREIGIRRTLGASRRQVTELLLRDFAAPVLIGNLLAWPLAWFGERLYLALFTLRMPFSPLPFAISLGVSLLVAALAVIWQSSKAAGRNPAETLHYE